jgi:hypothetical protein
MTGRKRDRREWVPLFTHVDFVDGQIVGFSVQEHRGRGGVKAYRATQIMDAGWSVISEHALLSAALAQAARVAKAIERVKERP